MCFLAISYPESSGFLVSGATPGRLWGHRKNSIFLIGCSVTVSIVLPQKSCGNKIRCPQSLPGVAPLTKKPEDSGYEIGLLVVCFYMKALDNNDLNQVRLTSGFVKSRVC